MHEERMTSLLDGLGGRNERITRLFENFSGYIRARLRRRRTLPAADVDDLTQEVFLRLLRYCDETAIKDPAAYLIRMTTNVANEWGERARVRLPHDDATLAELQCDPDEEPENVQARADLNRSVQAALSQLTSRRREVLLLHFEEGLTSKQIAERRGLTHRVVVRDLYRSYRALRLRLKTEEL
jgi:RNA polymerase sigma-70 factor (ECF subfamily)